MTVFVSYQRGDTAFAACALSYALRLGRYDVFVDTGSIGVGDAFRQAIANAIAKSHVVLALIGPSFDPKRLNEPTSVIAYEWQRARFHGIAVVPVLVDGGSMPPDAALPPQLRWFTRRNALVLRRASSIADIDACVDAIPMLAAAPRRAARVLWVDDRPSNNEYERHVLRPRGIVFDNVVSTDEALQQLANESYDLVITDLGRQESSDHSAIAGAEFLAQPVLRQGGPPVIVYAGRWAVSQRDDLVKRGALDVLSKREDLIEAVLEVLGRSGERADERAGDLQR